MTIIAYRNGVMASDSSCWSETTEVAKMKKIHRIRGGLVGVAGNLTDIAKFIKWLKEGALEEEYPIGNYEAITVDPSCRVTLWEGGGYSPVNIKGPYCAIGSGTDFALGAFYAGANPAMAVKAAIRHHAQCRGPISVWQLSLKIGNSRTVHNHYTLTELA